MRSVTARFRSLTAVSVWPIGRRYVVAVIWIFDSAQLDDALAQLAQHLRSFDDDALRCTMLARYIRAFLLSTASLQAPDADPSRVTAPGRTDL